MPPYATISAAAPPSRSFSLAELDARKPLPSNRYMCPTNMRLGNDPTMQQPPFSKRTHHHAHSHVACAHITARLWVLRLRSCPPSARQARRIVEIRRRWRCARRSTPAGATTYALLLHDVASACPSALRLRVTLDQHSVEHTVCRADAKLWRSGSAPTPYALEGMAIEVWSPQQMEGRVQLMDAHMRAKPLHRCASPARQPIASLRQACVVSLTPTRRGASPELPAYRIVAITPPSFACRSMGFWQQRACWKSTCRCGLPRESHAVLRGGRPPAQESTEHCPQFEVTHGLRTTPQRTADFGNKDPAESAPMRRFLAWKCELHSARKASQWRPKPSLFPQSVARAA